MKVLQENEYYRINSYYWFNMIYEAIEVIGDKTLCKIKGSKAKPKLIPSKHLSKKQKPLEEFN